MSTLKEIYKKYYGDLISKLQVNDSSFNSKLFSDDLFPGDTKDTVAAKATPAQASMYFLDNVINRGWTDDNTNSEFGKLLTIMANCDDSVVKLLASDIKKGNSVSVFHCMYM